MSGPASSNHHRLFGGLAVQMGYLSSSQLLEALRDWARDGAASLADWLRRRGWLSAEQAEALDRLVERRLAGEPVTPAPSLPEPPPATPPSTLGRYVRLRGHVAHDQELRREVALRELHPDLADEPGARSRFVHEAEITANLEHPGIVPVYSLGTQSDGRPYSATRLIQGETLHDAVARHHADPGALGLRPLLTRFAAACRTVAYAHSRGVIHRDLKPSNVLLGEYGETYVVGWGLAAVLDHPQSPPDAVTTPGYRPGPGAAAYLAPEQARGEWDKVGPQSDVFALGAVLHHLLSAAPAPAALRAVCARAMAPRRADRYASATELAAEVERWLADEPVAAYREPLAARAARWARRHRALVSAAVVLLLAGAVGLAGLRAVSGELRQARAEALPPAEAYDLARALAQASATAPDGAAEAHARRAVALLRRAAAAGHFRDPAHRAELAKDADLDALRHRADFRALLAEAGGL